MAGVHPRIKQGPDTYTCSAAVVAGRVVMPDTTTGKEHLVVHATSGATTVLGVSMNDALPTGSDVGNDYSTRRPEVTVCYGPATIKVQFSAAANFGDTVVVTTNGQVGPGTTAVVGRCVQTTGVEAGTAGLVRLYI